MRLSGRLGDDFALRFGVSSPTTPGAGDFPVEVGGQAAFDALGRRELRRR